MHRADPDQGTALDQPRLNLDQGHVSLFGDQLTDESAMGLDLARMPVATARLGHSPAMFQRKSSPADRTRHADPKARRRGTAAQAAIDRCDNPVPKIL
jgi:hypothetical protein